MEEQSHKTCIDGTSTGGMLVVYAPSIWTYQALVKLVMIIVMTVRDRIKQETAKRKSSSSN